jgi:hypothetical protein
VCVCVCVWKVGAALAWGWLGRCVAWVAGGRERVGRVGGGGGWWDEVITFDPSASSCVEWSGPLLCVCVCGLST